MSVAVSTPEKIRWFEDISIEDVPLVGGKNASLGEMYRELDAEGVRVPNGFAVTAGAYRDFLSRSGVDQQIQAALSDLDTRDIDNLRRRGRLVRHEHAQLAQAPDELTQAPAVARMPHLVGPANDAVLLAGVDAGIPPGAEVDHVAGRHTVPLGFAPRDRGSKT